MCDVFLRIWLNICVQWNQVLKKSKLRLNPQNSSIEFQNLPYTLSGTIGLSISLQSQKDIQHLLQHGENFSLPSYNKGKIITELIKNIENNTKKFDAHT